MPCPSADGGIPCSERLPVARLYNPTAMCGRSDRRFFTR